MARPIKEPHEKRTERFNLRYTLAEIEHIRTQAAVAGLGVHEYVRRRTLGHAVPPAPARSSDPALVSELNRVGVNVNQLARAAHRGSTFVDYWREVGQELKTVLITVATRHGA